MLILQTNIRLLLPPKWAPFMSQQHAQHFHYTQFATRLMLLHVLKYFNYIILVAFTHPSKLFFFLLFILIYFQQKSSKLSLKTFPGMDVDQHVWSITYQHPHPHNNRGYDVHSHGSIKAKFITCFYFILYIFFLERF